jgi:hypothetical protein
MGGDSDITIKKIMQIVLFFVACGVGVLLIGILFLL